MKDTKFQLKTPVSGDYQTSFVLLDINADGSDEAFVFYSDASSVESSVRMAFMECINEEWKITSDIKGAGSGVYDIFYYLFLLFLAVCQLLVRPRYAYASV